ncbi:MAG: hypothetical protein AAF483_07535 [Planctomycetota bacterium]
MWHEQTKQARESGELVVLGVIQEQHAERCRLYAQWKQYDWTIVQDPINRLDARAVPYFVAIDEAGVVVDSSLRSNEFEAFMSREPAAESKPNAETVKASAAVTDEQLSALAEATVGSDEALAWKELAEQRVLWHRDTDLSQAVEEFQKAQRLSNDLWQQAEIAFGLGVALRMRYDQSADTSSSDFQAATDAWGTALQLDPNQYIYRRRIQQYGPRLIKPYPFYDWVEEAREEIAKRGEEPIALVVPPSGAEIAQPSRQSIASSDSAVEPDPQGKINRDLESWIECEATVVPGSIRAGQAVRVHLQWTPQEMAHWNNEAEPVQIWIDLPEGWTAAKQLHELTQPAAAESTETRRLEFELNTPVEAKSTELTGYCLYYVCEEQGGTCMYLRKDIKIPIRIEPDAFRFGR